MNLRPRFFLLTIVLFLVSALPIWLAVRMMAESIFEQWAQRYTEKQVLYDKARSLQPILREVALSRQMAYSPYLIDWAHDPDNATKQQRALAEMERFRQNFTDHSYFIGLSGNRHYYHNNAKNEFKGQEFRYLLNKDASKDAWFFDLIRQQQPIHINVNPDPELGITKLWIDVLIRDGHQILGIAGTGLDLTSFIKEVVESGEPGITSLFVDLDGAIQLHRNQSFIDFNTISKRNTEHKSIDLLFDRAEDRNAIAAAMKELRSLKKSVITTFVHVEGKRQLAGVTYVPELAWFEITLLDLDVLLPFSNFAGISIAYVATLLGVLVLFNIALGHFVLRPLRRLDKAMSAIESGTPSPETLVPMGTGEIRQLLQRFTRMAQAVIESRRDLEAKVQDRTAALERLTKIDPLTELLNRRGMTEHIETELARVQRERCHPGILWLDIDSFKDINDDHGHAIGDKVLRAITDTIRAALRPYDVAARWGGDEFLILVQATDHDTLNRLGERLRLAIRENRNVLDASGNPLTITASVGCHVAEIGESIDVILQHGDQALYAAKAAGRDCYRQSLSQIETKNTINNTSTSSNQKTLDF